MDPILCIALGFFIGVLISHWSVRKKINDLHSCMIHMDTDIYKNVKELKRLEGLIDCCHRNSNDHAGRFSDLLTHLNIDMTSPTNVFKRRPKKEILNERTQHDTI